MIHASDLSSDQITQAMGGYALLGPDSTSQLGFVSQDFCFRKFFWIGKDVEFDAPNLVRIIENDPLMGLESAPAFSSGKDIIGRVLFPDGPLHPVYVRAAIIAIISREGQGAAINGNDRLIVAQTVLGPTQKLVEGISVVMNWGAAR